MSDTKKCLCILRGLIFSGYWICDIVVPAGTSWTPDVHTDSLRVASLQFYYSFSKKKPDMSMHTLGENIEKNSRAWCWVCMLWQLEVQMQSDTAWLNRRYKNMVEICYQSSSLSTCLPHIDLSTGSNQIWKRRVRCYTVVKQENVSTALSWAT